MFDAPEPPNMELDTRIERLEMILFSRQELTGWVKADTAAKIVGVSARKLVAMYDQGKLPTAAIGKSMNPPRDAVWSLMLSLLNDQLGAQSSPDLIFRTSSSL